MTRRPPWRSLRVLPQSLRLVHRASPRLSVVVLLLESTGSLVALGQVVAVGFLIGRMLDTTASSAETVLPSLVAFAAVTALGGILAVVSTNAQRLLGDRVYSAVLQETLAVAQAAPLSSFDSEEFSERLHRIEENSTERPFVLARSVASLLGAVLTSSLLIAYLVSVQWYLPLLAVIAGLPVVWAARLASRREYAFAVAVSPEARWQHYLARLLTERAPAKEVRAYDLGAWLIGWYSSVHRAFTARLRRHLVQQTLVQAAANTGGAVLLAATLGVLVLLVVDGRIQFDSAAAAAVALRTLAARTQGAASSSSSIYESGLFLEDFHDFVTKHRSSGRDRALDGSAEAVEAFSELVLDDVGFSYPGASRAALHAVSLRLARGDVVALVGGNGSGKTTLAKIVSQLYVPSAGRVLWNGRQLSQSEALAARGQIAVLFQDFGRYGFSAHDNVVLSRGPAPSVDGSEGEAHLSRRDAAAEAAGAAQIIEELRAGWDTRLAAEYGGQDLSLGQWQRLALARARFRDAAILVLDEPTAALDPRAEARLFDDVRTTFADRAVLLITHRLTSARGADLIVVMSGGTVVERGTHAELMALGGEYSTLWNLQAAGYAVDEDEDARPDRVRASATASRTRPPVPEAKGGPQGT